MATSELTLAELLTRPLANDDTRLVRTDRALLSDAPALTVVSVSRDILVAAAGRRASDEGLKLPDAIHIATAQAQGCEVVVSDERWLLPPLSLRRLSLAEDTLRAIESAAP